MCGLPAGQLRFSCGWRKWLHSKGLKRMLMVDNAYTSIFTQQNLKSTSPPPPHLSFSNADFYLCIQPPPYLPRLHHHYQTGQLCILYYYYTLTLYQTNIRPHSNLTCSADPSTTTTTSILYLNSYIYIHLSRNTLQLDKVSF